MPIEPTLAEVIESAIDSRMLDLHTMIVAKVVSYDATTQAAVVQPVVNGAAPNADGTTTQEPLPSIPNVPVRWERAGGYYTHLPLTAGDCGMLIFSESAFALWRVNGEISDPGDLTRHGLSYCYFLPGAWPDAQALTDAPAAGEAVTIVPGGGHLRVSKAGVAGSFVSLDPLVQALIANLVTWIKTGVAPSGGGPVTYAAPFSAPSTAATSLKSD